MMRILQFDLNEAIVLKGAKNQWSVVHSVIGMKRVKKASERKPLRKKILAESPVTLYLSSKIVSSDAG